MSKKTNDIADNEIRIISASGEPAKQKNSNRFLRVYLPVIAAALLLTAIVWIFVKTTGKPEEAPLTQVQNETLIRPSKSETIELTAEAQGSLAVIDTIINKKGLLILYPENLKPSLVIGSEGLNDSTIILATQAADIRKDNGEIAGTFVMNGELISKGEAKAGFCSIINGDLTIGVSDATSMLEQSLTENGYFFRQYPLVVGGQIVENKPKGTAIRKALAEINGKICVIMSKGKLTFHDFSQLLIDAGVRNAIYLVGGSSYGYYVNDAGERILTGVCPTAYIDDISYIIWK